MSIREPAARKLARQIIDAMSVPETTLLVTLTAMKIMRGVDDDEMEQSVEAAEAALNRSPHQLKLVRPS